MSDLIKIEPVRASQIEEEQLAGIIGRIITKTAIIAGQTISGDALTFTIEGLVSDLQKRYIGIELPELITACENGVLGDYGEWYGINRLSINQWIQGYISSGEHQKYLNSKPVPAGQKQIATTSTKTKEEIDSIMRAGIIHCFADYKKTGFVIDFSSVRYDWLFLNKILVPNDEQIEYYLSEARKKIEQDARVKNMSASKHERYDALKELHEIENLKDTDSKIQSEAKKMAIAEWFEELIETKQDINQLIKS